MCCTGSAPGQWVQQSIFFPSRTVLISIYPGPPAKALCGRDSCICVIPSHCCSDLSLTWGPLDSSAFSSWPLSFQKLDSGQLPGTWGFPRPFPFSMCSSAGSCGRWAGSASTALYAGRVSPAPRREPPYILISFPSVSEIPFLRASRRCFALAVLCRPGVV